MDFTLPVSFVIFLVGKSLPPCRWEKTANDVVEIFACFGAAGLSIAAVSWFAISIPIVIAVLVMIQRFYVRTSKQLRILEYVQGCFSWTESTLTSVKNRAQGTAIFTFSRDHPGACYDPCFWVGSKVRRQEPHFS